MAVRVEQELVVRVDGEVQPWVPNTMTRDGEKYIRLHLKDLNIVRFLGLEERNEKKHQESISCVFFGTLRLVNGVWI